MDNLLSKFSVPFTGDDPDEFVEMLMCRRALIKNVYLGHRRAFPQFHPYEPGGDERAERVMHLLRGRVPVLMTLNVQLPKNLDVDAFMDRCGTTAFLTRHGVDGVIVADPRVARHLFKHLPRLMFYTSVNTPEVNLDEWPPLEAVQLRRDQTLTRGAADHWHRLGQRVKVMLNEWCVVNCAYTAACVKCASVYAVDGERRPVYEQLRTLPLRSRRAVRALACPSMILPRWLPSVATWADELKLVGKNTFNEWLFNALDLYTAGVDARMDELAKGFCIHGPRPELAVHSSVYDDRLRTCGHRWCAGDCPIRRATMARLVEEGVSEDALL